MYHKRIESNPKFRAYTNAMLMKMAEGRRMFGKPHNQKAADMKINVQNKVANGATKGGNRKAEARLELRRKDWAANAKLDPSSYHRPGSMKKVH